ncbi:MAG: hypothetical protein HN600_01590 [Bacteroidetes bacterium]|jgi:hypothetical protein|nr:hypothetical protein [Bacteroidota bacterium]
MNVKNPFPKSIDKLFWLWLIVSVFISSCQKGLDIDYEELANVRAMETPWNTEITIVNDSIACITSFSSKHKRNGLYKKEFNSTSSIKIIKYNNQEYDIISEYSSEDNVLSTFCDSEGHIYWISEYIHKDSLFNDLYNYYPSYIDYFNKVYRTSDSGKTWDLVSVLPMNPSNIIETKNGNIFADVFMSSDAGYGLFKSTDHCQSWHRVNNGLPDNPRSNRLYADQNDCLYAVVNDQLYLSESYGFNWSRWGPQPIDISQIHNFRGSNISIGLKRGGKSADPQQFYYISADPLQFYISYDNGLNWELWMEFNPEDVIGHILTDFVLDKNGKLIFGMIPYGLLKPSVKENIFESINEKMAYEFLVVDLEINSKNILLVGTATQGLKIIDLNQFELGEN